MSAAVLPLRRDRIDLLAGSLLTFCCLAWGVQQVAIKVGIAQGLPPVLQAGLRSLLAAVLLIGWEIVRGNWRRMMARDGTLALGLLIGVLFAAEFVTLFPGLARTTASRGVLVLYTSPFFVAAGAHLLIPGERMNARQFGGLLLAFAGVALAEVDALRSPGTASGSLIGDGLVLLGSILWAVTMLVIKTTRLARLSAAKVLLYQLAGSVPVLLIMSLLLHESWSLGGATGLAWLALLYQGAGVAFVSYLVWFWLIAHYPVGRVSAFTFLTPLFGLVAGGLMLGERISPMLVLALVCVACGLRLVNARRMEGP